MNGITTVKLHSRTKMALDELKGEFETYDALISKLAQQAKRRTTNEKLVEAYRSLGKDDIELLDEWETASKEVK
jgi:hypothetical protein